MATMVKTCRRGNPGMEMISLANSSEMAELGLNIGMVMIGLEI